MAARNFKNKQYSLEPDLVHLFCYAGIGATGACTLKKWTPSAFANAPTGGWKGIASITRGGTGNYAIKLQDAYQHCVGVRVTYVNATAACVSSHIITDASATAAAPTVTIGVEGSTGTLADPDNGATMIVELIMINSGTI
jgi:hypothetical protein